MRFILASQSPRRSELLRAAGFTFDIVPVDIDERALPGERARDYVRRLALAKAREVACRNPGSLVLGADTTVVVNERLLGKPADDNEATEMLETLSGRDHEVLTGVALACDGREASEVACTRVGFLHLSVEEIAWYVQSGEPRDKAGAYAIQGLACRYIDYIDGSYSNVVGLPVATVYRLMKSFGVPVTGA